MVIEMTRNFPKNNPTIRNEEYILPGEPAYQLSKYIRDYKIRKEGSYYNIYAMTFYGEWEKVSGIRVSKGNAAIIETLRNKGKVEDILWRTNNLIDRQAGHNENYKTPFQWFVVIIEDEYHQQYTIDQMGG